MIIGSLNNLSDYNKLHPLFSKAFEYLKSINLNNPQIGKVEIDGQNLFISIGESTLKSPENAKLEAHDKYIDIQLPLSKSERFGWESREALKLESAPFNSEKDIHFFEDKPSMYIDVQPGNFIIFYPTDAHAPCIGEGSILKIVIKVKVD